MFAKTIWMGKWQRRHSWRWGVPSLSKRITYVMTNLTPVRVWKHLRTMPPAIIWSIPSSAPTVFQKDKTRNKHEFAECSWTFQSHKSIFWHWVRGSIHSRNRNKNNQNRTHTYLNSCFQAVSKEMLLRQWRATNERSIRFEAIHWFQFSVLSVLEADGTWDHLIY
jgi:hypothetical protein